MGDWQIFLKPAATFSLIKSYQMSLISAGSISMDSTFNSSFRTEIMTKIISFRVNNGNEVKVVPVGCQSDR